MLIDKSNKLWISTIKAIDILIPETGNIKHIKLFSNNQYATSFCIDSLDNFWIGTNYGLYKYNSNKLIPYLNNPKNRNSISDNQINKLFLDKRKKFWIATSSGLNLYNYKFDNFTVYTSTAGLDNNFISNIAEDLNNNLWLCNSTGLVKFNPQTKNVKKYDQYDGLNTDGTFLLITPINDYIFCNQSKSGFYLFKPQDIKENNIVPPVYITDFFIFNQRVTPHQPNSPLLNDISETKRIVLKHSQSVIGFEISVLNFISQEKNQIAYKLQGFDKNWVYTNAKNRNITYTNLNPGKYVLHVKGCNNDGVWNSKSLLLQIIITPPIWRTYWAYSSYIAVILLIFLAYRQNAISRYRQKTKLKIERIESEKTHELDQMKLSFFANISHELRTPLTLILSPITRLIQKASIESIKNDVLIEQLLLIQRNAQRLTELTNQLLDMQKLGAGKMQVEIYFADIVNFIKKIADKFEPIAEIKAIEFIIKCNCPKMEGWFDPDKTEKIVINILSNAFKYTNNRVEVNINAFENNIIIDFIDNGLGITPEQQNKIFDRFYQINATYMGMQEGSGIGLSLAKELVELLSGTLSVKSQLGLGTNFTVNLPLFKDTFRTYYQLNSLKIKDEAIELPLYLPNNELKTFEETPTNNNISILIVEDNADLRLYLKMALSEHYVIFEASNGTEGLAKTIELMPDLIISDVMMPEMNGIEMTKKIKSDQNTCHIPVILLTALTTNEHEVEGLETGANDYLPKPFNEDILLIRVRNLLHLRKLLQQHYATVLDLQKGANIFPQNIQVTSLNNRFITKAIEVVEGNISNPNFSNQFFASEMGISEPLLYKKINALLGKSPADFIREMRLKRAMQLLEQSKFPVAEVAYLVGFNDPKYFGKCFKNQFGKSPSDVINKNID